MNITPEQREEWRRLDDSATTGPWEAYENTVMGYTDGGCTGCSGTLSPSHLPENHIVEIAEANTSDAEFIAVAREAVPALLDALDTAESERDVALAVIERARKQVVMVIDEFEGTVYQDRGWAKGVVAQAKVTLERLDGDGAE